MMLATLGYRVISLGRKAVGKGDIAKVSRGGLRWVLDLREGIDLTIFVLGYFQRSTVRAWQTAPWPWSGGH